MARPCVLDASLLITFGKSGALDVLRKAPAFSWTIGALARGELLRPETKGPVEQMILEGVIDPVELDSDDEAAMALFVEWMGRVDAGEAESIAIALARGWLVGIEDLAAQRSLDRVVGPGQWINCANVLIAAVRANQVDLNDADAVFRKLDVFSGYAKRGITSLNQMDESL